MSLENMPKLGFGLMRLPETDGKIDMQQVCDMVDAYMASGANYFDTAYVFSEYRSGKGHDSGVVEVRWKNPCNFMSVADFIFSLQN